MPAAASAVWLSMTQRNPGGEPAASSRPSGTPKSAARSRLAAERDRAEARLRALARDFDGIVTSSAAGDDEHDPEGATNAFERQHIAALIDQARAHLADIAAALGRLDAGGYGTCERCGQPIGDERLHARPAARTCISCAAARRS
jgi:RNA polymerase-binding transcription factor DksA